MSWLLGMDLFARFYAGTGTILIYDKEKSEILGFLAPGVSAERFISSMLPVLIDGVRGSNIQFHGFYKEVTNDILHDDN